ncbi:MAG: hypothetical protein HQK69_07505 [Desulfamplus sp.]|nr:hypothetical protein [Desulfamplus sp.]
MINSNHSNFDYNEDIDLECGCRKCTDCNNHRVYKEYIEEDSNNERVKMILGIPRIVGKNHLLFRGWGRPDLDLCEKIEEQQEKIIEICKKKRDRKNRGCKIQKYKDINTNLIKVGWGRYNDMAKDGVKGSQYKE